MVGLGEEARLDADAVRRAAGVAARAVANAASVTLALPAADAAHVRAVTEGYLLGGYTFSVYKSAASSDEPGEVVVLSDAARDEAAREAFETAQVVAVAVRRTRDWVNTPPGRPDPRRVRRRGVARPPKHHKVTVTVMDEKELARDGFGGIIGVGQGSANPPRLVKLTYQPHGAKTHLGLVGKGITYDSGGLTIKPGTSMQTMKSDMAGGAAVVNATLAIAELGLPIAVTTWVPMAENMVSGSATRPGDVLTMYGGKTVEVLNTDAEGRLILGRRAGARQRGASPTCCSTSRP